MSHTSRLPGIGSHHSASAATDEWWTPPDITRALHPFDLDPCAPHQHPGWSGAHRSYTIDDDGLSQPWNGFVWLNPPYSDIAPWMSRLADHGNGIALVFVRCETTWWFEHVWPHTSGIRMLAGRITFWQPPPTDPDTVPLFDRPDLVAQPTPSRAGHNSGGPSCLIAYGTDAAERLARCTLTGIWLPRVGWEITTGT